MQQVANGAVQLFDKAADLKSTWKGEEKDFINFALSKYDAVIYFDL